MFCTPFICIHYRVCAYIEVQLHLLSHCFFLISFFGRSCFFLVIFLLPCSREFAIFFKWREAPSWTLEIIFHFTSWLSGSGWHKFPITLVSFFFLFFFNFWASLTTTSKFCLCWLCLLFWSSHIIFLAKGFDVQGKQFICIIPYMYGTNWWLTVFIDIILYVNTGRCDSCRQELVAQLEGAQCETMKLWV